MLGAGLSCGALGPSLNSRRAFGGLAFQLKRLSWSFAPLGSAETLSLSQAAARLEPARDHSQRLLRKLRTCPNRFGSVRRRVSRKVSLKVAQN
jgi:hypothetical protein